MTKIDIISGFLGAGKTTFIKKMLEEVFSGEKVVLVENEYGEVGIDGGFLKDAGFEIKESNSGCICKSSTVSIYLDPFTVYLYFIPLVCPAAGIHMPYRNIRSLTKQCVRFCIS